MNAGYLLSMAMGVKSSLCLLWKSSILALISTMDGGLTGMATLNSAS